MLNVRIWYDCKALGKKRRRPRMYQRHEDSDVPETLPGEEKATTETQPTPKKISTARAGGRVESSSRRLANARPSAGDGGSIVLSLSRLAILLLAAWLALQMLFGGIGGLISPGSYVFLSEQRV
jgi:hypothetical protein